MPEMRIILKDIEVPGIENIGTYIERGGYAAVRKALTQMTPDEVIDEVRTAALAGRGGAWFPTGTKWSFMPKEPSPGRPSFLCVNADESEPGTFKDRILVEHAPHQLIEGIIAASYAIRARCAFVYIRGEMARGKKILDSAIAQAYSNGLLGENLLGSGYSLDIYTHPGAGAYICGEETGLMQSLEGKRAEPRIKPPFPAQRGIFGCPTTVNNVQTLSYVPHIINNGAAWFRSFGTEKYPGTFIFCVSGNVKNPGAFELSIGSATMREIIEEYAGGVRDGHALKAVIPGGSSAPVMTPDQIDVVMDPALFAVPGRGPVKAMFGTGGMIVMDDATCMVDALLNLMRFYAHESCGQCTPCREGAPWIRDIIRRIEHGEGKAGDIELVLDVASNIAQYLSPVYTTICLFGPSFAWPVWGMINSFRAEFDEHIKQGRCPIEKDKSIKGTPQG